MQNIRKQWWSRNLKVPSLNLPGLSTKLFPHKGAALKNILLVKKWMPSYAALGKASSEVKVMIGCGFFQISTLYHIFSLIEDLGMQPMTTLSTGLHLHYLFC